MNNKSGSEPMQGQQSTHPEHDCHAWNYQHWHMQRPYTYSTCGICGRMTKIEKAPELEYLQKLCEEQKGEIANLAKYLSLSPEEVKEDGFFGRALARKLKEVEDLKSQLATQTERVRVLEVALTDIRGLHTCCNQCAITSGEGWCVTYQLAKQALQSTKESK